TSCSCRPVRTLPRRGSTPAASRCSPYGASTRRCAGWQHCRSEADGAAKTGLRDFAGNCELCVNVNLEFTAWLPMLPTVPWPPRTPDTGVDPIQERHVRRLLFSPGGPVRARDPDAVPDLPAGLARFLRAAG